MKLPEESILKSWKGWVKLKQTNLRDCYAVCLCLDLILEGVDVKSWECDPTPSYCCVAGLVLCALKNI